MNKKLRFYVWMLQGYFTKHIYRILIASGVGILLIVGLYLWIPTLTKVDDTVFIEGIVGKYTRKQLPSQVLEYISKGLVTTDESGNPVPLAAESIETSQDGKTFTVRLKKGVKWHNGAELSSNDLAYNLTDVEVEKPDSSTLIFKLKDSFAPFPTLLTGPLVKVAQNDQVLGIGDYYIKSAEYTQSQYITSLELESAVRKPKTIKIKFYASEEDAVTALKLGQIHGLSLASKNSLENWNNVIVYRKVMPRRFIGVYFKYDDPIIGGKDATLRQAMSMAVTDVPNEIAFSGPFPPNSWASGGVENKYRNNKEKAAELIKASKIPQKNANGKIEITLTTLSPYKSVAEHVANDWRAAGLDVKIEESEKIPEKFQALLLAQELPTDPDQYSLWHSTQKRSNITGYTNARVDKDLEDARKTVDREVRAEKYADFQKQIFTDIPVIYLYQPTSQYAVLKKYSSDSVLKLKKFK